MRLPYKKKPRTKIHSKTLMLKFMTVDSILGFEGRKFEEGISSYLKRDGQKEYYVLVTYEYKYDALKQAKRKSVTYGPNTTNPITIKVYDEESLELIKNDKEKELQEYYREILKYVSRGFLNRLNMDTPNSYNISLMFPSVLGKRLYVDKDGYFDVCDKNTRHLIKNTIMLLDEIIKVSSER